MNSPEPVPIDIGGYAVGAAAPFIIAELSGNHNGSLERALAIVDAVADAGAHALKLQTYTADTMTLNIASGPFVISDPKSLWAGRTLYDLYNEACTPWEWHTPIMERCARRGLVCFSSPFDETSLQFLEELDVPAYKVASFENTDIPLLKKIAATGRPVIMSTGLVSEEELRLSVEVLRNGGCTELILLKCTSAYPAPPERANLATLSSLREMFATQVGLSDHTTGVGVAVAAVALGATVIEKHVTLQRSDGGVDSAFSLEPHELKELVTATDQAWRAIGKVSFALSDEEKKSLQFRRSCYIAAPIKKGEPLTPANLRIVRPAGGLEPRYYDECLGKRVSHDVEPGTPLSRDLIE